MGEADVSKLLSVAEAIAILDAAPVHPRIVELPLSDAQGLILAQDISADRDYPPFDKSLMDGLAVRCQDVTEPPVQLQLVGEIPAGEVFSGRVQTGQAVAIMTGAPLPSGADGVVPVEDASPMNESTVRVNRADDPARHISRRGSDINAGAVVLSRGMKLGPAQIAVAASVGAARVRVYAPARVAVLATGDELVPIDATPAPQQIRNSNSIMLMALLKRLGCEAHDLGIARDDPRTIRASITDALRYDALFITGGMSMGERDYVPGLLRDMGAELKITKLRIKPGKPFIFAVMPSSDGPRYVFGLPGNPVSSFVCATRLASRLLCRIGGATIRQRWIRAPLARALEANGPREFYQPALLRNGLVEPLGWKGSADVFTLAQADALLVRAANEPAIPENATVNVLEIAP